MAILWKRQKKTRISQDKTTEIGSTAEDFARTFLRRQGLTIIDRNFISNLGEIDLIAEDGSELVFVEVRFRANASHGSASESVTLQKRLRLIKTAQIWLQSHQRYTSHYCRFDVIAIDSVINTKHTTWEKNAFQIE